MRKTKHLWIALFALLMLAVFMPTEVKAETHEIYTYTVEDGKATVVGCQTSVSGHIAVPSTMGGYPVTTIGAKAFDGCTKLVRITLSEGITTIAENAFSNCPLLEEITLPDGFTTIGAGAFVNCGKLTKLHIPDTIAYIDGAAFDNWDILSYHEYGNGKYLGNTENRYLVFVGVKDKELTSCELHESTRIILDEAFFECVGLSNITIPDGVRTIGKNAFFRCTNLRKITIGSSVTTIGEKAFALCGGLTAVTVPDGVTAIGKEAFSSCNKMTDIVLPVSLTTLGEGAFNGCTKLQNIYYKGTEEQWALLAGNEPLQNVVILYNASGCIHKWDEGVVTKEPNCVEPGEKTYTCTVCQEKRKEDLPITEIHTYQNDCDPECDFCLLVREITHSYSDTWSADETGHYYACTVCGEKKEAALPHTPSAEPTQKDPQICLDCGYIIQPALGHTHNYGTDWRTDTEGHWHACDGCEEKSELAAHSFENACDADCAVCGYVRTVRHTYKTEWSVSTDKHWHECTACGNKKDESAHVPGPAATETMPQTCTDCGYELASATGIPDPTEPEPTEPKPNEDQNGRLVAIIIVSVAIVIAVTLGVFEVVGMRKKK